MNTLQKIIESQRDVDDLTLTFIIEKRHNQKKVKVLTLYSIKKKLNN